ncbi:uncharacterized protein LOC113748703 isoform X4 [Coffea eugenioides]|uniref:Uncharacterized protein isoform X5 n=1 Tax=Coffea arabica TaxID=13443 RepID=A0ABM4W0Y2_COFAR|nr:uncharacterized protein LOC113748703 isoform X4 [Coffea eugenioides]
MAAAVSHWRRRRSSLCAALVVVGAVIVAFFGVSPCNALLLSEEAEEDNKSLVSRIAFGSCANQSAPQPIWDAIIDFNPHVFIWLGDNIYGDIRRPFRLFGKQRTIGPWKNVPRFIPSSEHEMQSRYLLAKNSPGYSRLRLNTKVIGTWDDHDYGLNDAGKEFSAKITNQRLLLDFLDEPQDSPRRKQAGVYASYTFGPRGRQVKVILLDTRYHRDPLFSDGSIVGSLQWEWLAKELKGPATAITIIGSSIQREGVFFISGDVHFGEITRYDCAAGYPLYDITSSGITQAVEKAVPSPLHFLVRFAARLTPSTMRVMDRGCSYSSCTYGKPNFGIVEINWDTAPVNLKFEVRDENGDTVIGVNTSLSQLKAQRTESKFTKVEGKYKNHCLLEVELPWMIRYRLAIMFFCTVGVLLLLLIGVFYTVISLCSRCLQKCKLD